MSTYTIPNVITRSAGGERIMDVYSHLLSSRIVYPPGLRIGARATIG